MVRQAAMTWLKPSAAAANRAYWPSHSPDPNVIILNSNQLSAIAVPRLAHRFLRESVLALEEPERYAGRVIPLAGDELSIGEIIRTFKAVTGRKPWVAPIPAFLAKRVMPKEFLDLFPAKLRNLDSVARP